MTRYSYHFLFAIIFSAILLGSCTDDTGRKREELPDAVTVTVASARTQVTSSIYASGRLETTQAATLSARIMGYVKSIYVSPGEAVTKGQLLATISSDDIQAKKAQAQALIAEVDAALNDAQKDYQRFATLYEKQSASTKEFENAALHLNSMKAKAEAAKQVEREAHAMLAYTNLVAPFSGIVTQKLLDAGSMASPGVPILVLENPKSFKAKVSVTEADIDHIQAGTSAEIEVKSSGRKIQGKVFEISPSSHFSDGQYFVGISIPENENEGLFAGMYVQASIASSADLQNTQHLLVPVSAIVHKDQMTGLYTLSENQTALLRWVKLGRQHKDTVEVLAGLSADEKFIATSDGKLFNGIPVKVTSAGNKRTTNN